MKAFRVHVNDQIHHTEVEQVSQGTFRVILENESALVDVLTKQGISDLTIRIGSETVRACARRLGDLVEVSICGVTFSANCKPAGLSGPTTRSPTVTEKTVGTEIRALMPGRVTSILVKTGDRVEAGAPLMILEAMKMQNEISSPFDGKVRSISVVEGSTVKKDAVLIEIAAD